MIAEYCERFRELADDIRKGLADPAQMPERCQAYFLLPEIHWKDTGAVAVREFSLPSLR